MALDVQISIISATRMTDGETRKSIYFLRPSLCYFRRSCRLRCALGKANDGRLGSIDQAMNFSRKTNTRDMRNLRAGRRSRATVTKFIGQSTCPTDGTCHFLEEHIQRSLLSLLGVTSRSPADSLLSFGKLAAELHVHQNRRCFITLLVVPPLWTSPFSKGGGLWQVAFCADEISKTTTCQDATQQ